LSRIKPFKPPQEIITRTTGSTGREDEIIMGNYTLIWMNKSYLSVNTYPYQ
jgi:hypothetical protein